MGKRRTAGAGDGGAEHGGAMGAFGRAVEAASREAGVLGGAQAKPRPKPGGESEEAASARRAAAAEASRQRLLGAMLVDAVANLDVAKARSLAEQGVVTWGRSGAKLGLLDAWRGRAELMAADDPEEGRLAPMLLWMDARGIPIWHRGGEQWGAFYQKGAALSSPSKLRRFRRSEMELVVAYAHGAMEPWEGRAYAALARSWSEDPDAAARVPLSAWIAECMDRAPRDSPALLCGTRVAVELGLGGAPWAPRHWAALAEGLMGEMPDPEHVGADVAGLMRAQESSRRMGPRALALLMEHALLRDDVGAMVEVASRCARPMWSLVQEAWSGMGLDMDEFGAPPSLMEYAAWAGTDCRGPRRDNRRLPDKQRFRCLRALALVPEARAAVSQGRALALCAARVEDVELIHQIAPVLLSPDAAGETVAHHWARGGAFTGERSSVVSLADLLWSSISHLVDEANAKGKSPADLLRARGPASPLLAPFEEAWARREARQLGADVAAGERKGPRARGGRL